jgi:myosin heavy subunit
LAFSVTHYAGKVTYQTVNFLEKNRDTVSRDVTALLRLSEVDLVRTLFTSKKDDTGSFKGGRGKKKSASTVCNAFANSLKQLMDKLNAADPHFVRCIKPNLKKAPSLFVDDMVTRQLRYDGVLETVRIRKVFDTMQYLC